MLMSFLVTVRRSAFALILAVFFSSSVTAIDGSLQSLETGLSDLVYDLSRSLVTVESYNSFPEGMGELPGHTALRRLVSSGLIVDSLGHIVVAAESVMGQNRVTVLFDEHRLPAQLVATDHYNMLALLRVELSLGVPVAYSDRQACAGQMVVAMGNAYGLRVSPSLGFCAGTRENGSLQFSVPVASGTIGGGIFDLSGRLLGQIIGSYGDHDRVVIAIPGYRISSAVDYMLNHGDRQAGYVGISGREIEISPPLQTASENLLATAGAYPIQVIDAGVLVTSVKPSSPAFQAGLREGDLIFAVGNKCIRTVTGLSDLVRMCEPGMAVNVEIVRYNTHYSVPLTVGRYTTASEKQNIDFRAAPIDEHWRVVDSLNRMLEMFRQEVSSLERRLNGLE